MKKGSFALRLRKLSVKSKNDRFKVPIIYDFLSIKVPYIKIGALLLVKILYTG